MKKLIKQFLPESLLKYYRPFALKRRVQQHDAEFTSRTPSEIFTQIYAKKWWGEAENSEDYCSGYGSHLSHLVEPYVGAVSDFLQGFNPPLNVVDLGCGDFNIGRQLRSVAGEYIACDIVPDLIERNSKKYHNFSVNFMLVDLINDPLPKGDVAILRQVLQHLSNKDILKVIPKLLDFRFLVFTDYVPLSVFVPNLDMPTGALSRLARGIPSGILLKNEPFCLPVKSERRICAVVQSEGLIVTNVYEL